MRALPATTYRASGPHLFAEVIATLGLLLVIFSLARSGRGNLAPAAVGAIAPASVPAFVLVQLLGGVVAIGVIRALYPDQGPEKGERPGAGGRPRRERSLVRA